MQRTRLSTVLASLGLGAACGLDRAQVVEPDAPLGGTEPSGLGDTPKSETASSISPAEPHFEGVPTQFCNAELHRRDDELLRTESFLQAWNELAPPIRNPLAQNIPATEIDARLLLCGAERCSLEAAKLTEVVADYMVGVGVLIPSEGGMLVIADLAATHTLGPCANLTEISVEQHGELVHVRALNRERRYNYGHYGGHYNGYNYDPVPIECRSYAVQRRDLVIDVGRGELELVIDQHRASEAELSTWVELAFTSDGIVLSGCATTLALAWVG